MCLIDNENGTFTDTCTGLTWTKSLQMYNYRDAIIFCQKLKIGGSTWRLPNVNELCEIAKHNLPSGWYWSSSASAFNPKHAHFMNFIDGHNMVIPETPKYYVCAIKEKV
jgi:hypothetical protein